MYIKLQSMQNEWVNIKANICKFGKYVPQSSVCFHSPADLMEKNYSKAPGKQWTRGWVGLKFGLNVAEKEQCLPLP
jgi:hypothetical protein